MLRDQFAQILRDPDRLAALYALDLLDTPPEPAFDRLTRLVVKVLNVPIALVTLLDADRQFFKSCVGLPEPWAARRETPLSHSFCLYSVATRAPLIIPDARRHPLVHDNPAIRELGIVAYADVPLITATGYALGSFCAIDTVPHAWSTTEVDILQELAAAAMTELELRWEIRARREAEAALRRSEARFRSLFQHAAVGQALIDLTGRFVQVNPALCQLTGYSEAELLATDVQSLTLPADRAPSQMLFDQLVAGTIPDLQSEHHYRRNDGAIIDVLVSAACVHDVAGAPEGVISITQDITARKRAEERLRASEERLRVVVTNAPIVLFAVDRTGVFTLSEGKGLAMLGLQPGEVVGQSVFDVYHDVPAILEHMRRALAGEAFCTPVEVGRLVYEVCYAPVRDAGEQVIGVIGVASDITERKRAEQERVALEELRAEFMANISHDLRTPLHHIKGYASLLRERGATLDEATRRDFTDTILDASARLERLLTDLLSTGRIISRELTLERARVRLDVLVERVVQRWQSISSHQFSVRLPAGVPAVLVDAGRIEQVLDNVLTNVVKHTPEHTSAEVEVHVADEGVEVVVIDHGPGVEAHQLPHVFERFYQIERRMDRARRGSGLGLFICKWIVEQHGGRIWAEPTVGGGLTIRFSLPPTTDPHESGAASAAGSTSAPSREET